MGGAVATVETGPHQVTLSYQLGVVVRTLNTSSREAEARQSGLCIDFQTYEETLSQKTRKKKKRKKTL